MKPRRKVVSKFRHLQLAKAKFSCSLPPIFHRTATKSWEGPDDWEHPFWGANKQTELAHVTCTHLMPYYWGAWVLHTEQQYRRRLWGQIWGPPHSWHRDRWIVVANIQVRKVVSDGVRAIQRSPRTFLPQQLCAGKMAMKRNKGKSSSMSGMFPKPTGADTFHALGAFQQNNSVRGFINGWQTPDALIGAIHAVNDYPCLRALQALQLMLYILLGHFVHRMRPATLETAAIVSQPAISRFHKTSFLSPASVEECVARLLQLPGRKNG